VFFKAGHIGSIITVVIFAASVSTIVFNISRCAGRDTKGGSIDTRGIERAEGLSESAGKRVGGLAESLDGSRDLVERSRGLVTGSLSVAGEIGNGLDTITGRTREDQERVDRIEEASQRIEQALDAIYARGEVLDGGGD
jgi:hypothetical protein